MDTGKVYFDSEGAECSIWQMVKREPTWAAVRIQEGEKATDEITALRRQLEQAEAEVQRVRDLAEKIRDIAIDSPASNNMQLIYRLACKQAEQAGGEK